jgi:cobalt-zinc-cadmium efflux system outer membrane protein
LEGKLMKHNTLISFALIISGLVALGAEIPPSVANGITPEALVRQALEKNPELNFYVAEIAAAQGGLKTAGTRRNPEFNAQAGYKNIRDRAGDTLGDGAAFLLSIQQTFEYPGRVALRKTIAKGDVELAELHLEQFRATFAMRVRTLAYGVLIAQERSTAAREVGDRLQSVSEILAQREPAGVTPLLETRIIEANTLALRRQEREAALAVKTALAELNQLRGQPPTAPLQLRSGPLAFGHASLPALLAAARAQAFDIRIREVELAQHGFKVLLSKNERCPALAIGPYYLHETAADKEQQAGIGFSLPLPFWDRNTGNIETSKARELQARASLVSIESEVERRVAQSSAIFQSKRDELDKWQADTLAKFRDVAELADRNYRSGAVPVSVYVETQKQYLEMLATVHDLKKDALQAAQEIEILTGFKLYKSEGRP